MQQLLPFRLAHATFRFAWLGFLLFLLPQVGWGQVQISATGTDYTQNFNTLTSPGAWANGTTLSGWYVKTDATPNITSFLIYNSTTPVAGLTSFGATTNEKSLGYYVSNAFVGTSGAGKGYLAWRLVNKTGGPIKSITVTYTGRQWKVDNAASQRLTFDYKTGTSLTDPAVATGWTAVTALDFVSPKTGTSTNIDGTVAGNFTANISAAITFSTPLQVDEEVMIRWVDLNDSGTDQILAIDDVKVSATGITNSAASNIIAKSGFTYPTNIAYAANTDATVTTANPEVFKFDIQDGGGTTDTDTVRTILNEIAFTVNGFASLNTLALFDGTTKLAETPVTGATVGFTGLSFKVADGGSRSLSLRATFKTIVTDNSQFSFEVKTLKAAATGSGFAAANGGGATSSTGNGENKIAVTASKLVFATPAAGSATVNTNMLSQAMVEARDANGNRDLDYAATATISNSANLPMTSAALDFPDAKFTGGRYTFPANLQFTQPGTTSLVIYDGNITSATSDPITVIDAYSTNSGVQAVGGSEAVSISSLNNTNPIAAEADGTLVWQFKLNDGDGNTDDGDNLPTIYKSFVFEQYTGNTVTNWANALADAKFFDAADGSLVTGTVLISNNSITFTPTTAITIADGVAGSKTLGLRITLKNPLPANSDNTLFAFKLTNATTSVKEPAFSSQLAAFTIFSDNSKNKVDVTATKLKFLAEPVNVFTNAPMAPVTVQALDANNNRDLDFTDAVKITATGATLDNTTVSATAVAGLATFTTLKFTTPHAAAQLTAEPTAATVSNASSANFSVTTATPVLTFKQGATIYAQGSTYTFTSQPTVGNTSTSILFTLGNAGNADLNNIAAAVSGDFEITTIPAATIPVGSTTSTVAVRFKPTGAGLRTGTLTIASNDANSPIIINLTGTGTVYTQSTIELTSGFTYPSNIDYTRYQAPVLTNDTDGLSVMGFTLRDGGGTDADDKPTTLQSITFSSVLGGDNIRTAAIFKGTTLIAQTNTIGTTIAFANLPASGPNALSAPDNGFANFKLVVSFKTTVIDNEQMKFVLIRNNCVPFGNNESSLITSVSAATSTSNDFNRLEVTATSMAWNSQPVTGEVNSDLEAVSLKAVDANGSTDLDFAGCTVKVTSPKPDFSSSSYTFSAGIATISAAKFSAVQTGAIIEATAQSCLGNLTLTSDPFNVVTIAYAEGDYRSKTTGVFATVTWERLVNGVWVATSAPNSSNTINKIFIGDGITPVNVSLATALTAPTPGRLTIMDGCTLTITGTGNNTLSVKQKLVVKKGGVLQVNAILGLDAAATFEVEDGATVNLNYGSYTNTSGIWSGTEKFAPNSLIVIKNYLSGGRIYDENITLNADGYAFGNLTIETPTNITLVNGNQTSLKLVRNNLILNSGGTVMFNNHATSMEVGNLYLNAGNLTVFATNVTATPFLKVNGIAEFNTGTVNINSSFGANTYPALDFAGRVKFAPGCNLISSDAGSTVNFTGTGLQEIEIAPDLTSLNIVYNIKSGAQVKLMNANLALKNGAARLTVESGASLDFNGRNITGTGVFTLQDGGTLKITDPDGITLASNVTTGNVQVSGLRTFGNGGNYFYTGNVAQTSGTGLPTTVNQFTLNNAGGLTLSNVLTVNSKLTLTDGVLKNILTNGASTTTNLVSIAATGTLTGGSATSYIEGPVAQTVASTTLTTLNFPIGKSGKFRPVTLAVTHGNTTPETYTAEQKDGRFAIPSGTTLPSTLDKVSDVRYFTISKAGAVPVSATVTLAYNTDDYVTHPNELSIAKYNPVDKLVDLGGTGTGPSIGTITSAPFSTFSDFMLANKKDGNNPLPVELVSFTATAVKNAVELNWATATELNSDRFEVERSANGQDFGLVASVKAAGNSTQLTAYKAEDNQPLKAIAYYRLKQIDQDGSYQYSKIVTLKPQLNLKALTLFPNPAAEKLTLVLPAPEKTRIQVLNMLGQVMLVKTVMNTTVLALELQHLAPGTYQVVAIGESYQSVTKFVKVVR